MRYYLEKIKSTEKACSIVIRGKTANGKPYRIFVKVDGVVKRVHPNSWNQKNQFVKGDPALNQYLKDLRVTLESKHLREKFSNPEYSIPHAWEDLFGQPKSEKQKLSNKVIDSIEPYLADNGNNKSAGYLRHYYQVRNAITIWNKDIEFSHLNEINLNSYLSYLQGQGEPVRKPLRSTTITHHYKHIRQLAKYAAQRGVQVDPTVFDFSPGKSFVEIGNFELTYDELMILWHYEPSNSVEELVLDYCLFEGFTGLRNGDIFSYKSTGMPHGIRCGDINSETITYLDRKNKSIQKSVTRHKFNERFIKKYLVNDHQEFLFKPISQQAINKAIKRIAKDCGLTRGIRRGREIRPLHECLASHCFRGTYGNLLFRLGVSADIIAEELGHAAVGVTKKSYLKFSSRHEIIREKMNNLEIKKPSKGTEVLMTEVG